MTLVNAINLKTGDVAEFDLINIKTSGNYKGLWDASTNTPFLTNGVGTEGDWYEVSVGGTVNFGAGDFVFSEGDTVSYIDGSWEKASEKIIDDSQISYNKTWSSAKIKEEIDVQVPLIVEEKVEEGLVGKQDLLTEDQLKAVNSGITAEKVAGYDGLSTDINNLSTEITTNKTDIATLKTDVGDIGDSITDLRNDKQDKLTAGNNITITEDGVISATGGETGSNIASDITYDNATSGLTADNVQNAIDELSVEKLDKTTDVANAGKSVVVDADGTLTFGSIIDDTVTSTDLTWSSSKISELTQPKIFGTAGDTQYLKLTIGNSSKCIPVTITDQYGGKIEILGMTYDGIYKTPKVVRYSYGDWSVYSATDYTYSGTDPNYKIRTVYYYPVNGCYYVEIRQYCTVKVSGAINSELVSSLPAETSEMTLIPENSFVTKTELAAQTANRQVTTFDNTGSSTEKWYKICSALTGGIGCNIKLTASRADSTATVQYFSALFRDSRYRYTSSYISKERTVYVSMLAAEYSAYIIADANNDIWVHVPSYGKAIIEIDTRVITIDGTVGTPVEDYVYSSFEHQYDERINDSATNSVSTWSSSKIASMIVGTKTEYYGPRSVDVITGNRLTFIFSSTFSTCAGCYMLLSNYNIEPVLVQLGADPQKQFTVTAVHKSNSVDTITVSIPETYVWYILQF